MCSAPFLRALVVFSNSSLLGVSEPTRLSNQPVHPHPCRPDNSLREGLCRTLCRNPAIPTHIVSACSVSLESRCQTWSSYQPRVNTAPRCYSDFFGIWPSRTGLRIRNNEVVGSIPTSSTKFSITCAGISTMSEILSQERSTSLSRTLLKSLQHNSP